MEREKMENELRELIEKIREELKKSRDKISVQFLLCDIEKLTNDEGILREIKDAYNYTEECDGNDLSNDEVDGIEFCLDKIEEYIF